MQLSLTVLALATGSEHTMLSCWDVGVQRDYEALQQQYITKGPPFASPCPAPNDAHYETVLDVGSTRCRPARQAPAALLTHADTLLSDKESGATVSQVLARTSQRALGALDAMATSGKFMYEFTLESRVPPCWLAGRRRAGDDPTYHYVGKTHGWAS